MAGDPRPWVRTHDEYKPVWHYYPNGHFEPAVCGCRPIPGMPYVAEKISTSLGGNVCLECLGAANQRKDGKQ